MLIRRHVASYRGAVQRPNQGLKSFFAEFGTALMKAADEVKRWPRGDLFSQKAYSQ